MSRILFIGATKMAMAALETSLMTRADARSSLFIHTLKQPTASSICDYDKGFSYLHNLGWEVNSQTSLTTDAALVRPDLIIVVGWSRLIPPEVLAIPPRGTVCFHAAKLPDYRGRAPIPHTILHDLGYTEMTMFYASEKADEGDIIASKGFYVGYKDDAGTLYEKHTKAIIALLDEHLDGLLDGTAPRRKQVGEGVWWPKRTPEMGEIDWGNTPVQLITATTKPYPGAFSYWKGRIFWVWEADLNSTYGSDSEFNEITYLDEISGAIIIDGDVMLLTVSETQDGEVIPAYELAMKWGMKVGDKLGRDV